MVFCTCQRALLLADTIASYLHVEAINSCLVLPYLSIWYNTSCDLLFVQVLVMIITRHSYLLDVLMVSLDTQLLNLLLYPKEADNVECSFLLKDCPVLIVRMGLWRYWSEGEGGCGDIVNFD